MQRRMNVGARLVPYAVATGLLLAALSACQVLPRRGGGPPVIFKATNSELADYDAAAAATPQFTFTDADTTVFVYFFLSFDTGDRWFIRFLSPSGTRDRTSDELTVPEGAIDYFVSAGNGIELFTENGDWEIALFVNDEEIARGDLAINRASLE